MAAVNGKMRWDAHIEHQAHAIPKEEKPEYSYQNIRTKNFFWGDGDKVSPLPLNLYCVGKHTPLFRVHFSPSFSAPLLADVLCRLFSGTTRSTTTRRRSKRQITSVAEQMATLAQRSCI